MQVSVRHLRRGGGKMNVNRCHVIAVVNHKGGCGKTTATVNLAAACALEGYTVCVVDIDQQCNATTGLGLDLDELAENGVYTVLDAYIKRRPADKIAIRLNNDDGEPRFGDNFFVVAGHRGLSQVTPKLDAELRTALANDHASDLDADDIRSEHRQRLAESINSLRDHADFVFIDCPPALGFHTTSALIAADSAIITVFPSGYDLNGLSALQQTMLKVQKRYNRRLFLLGVLLGNRHATAKLDKQILDHLGGEFKNKVFKATISSSVRHREAPLHGLTIFEHTNEQKPKDEFRALAGELVDRVASVQKPVLTPSSVHPTNEPDRLPMEAGS